MYNEMNRIVIFKLPSYQLIIDETSTLDMSKLISGRKRVVYHLTGPGSNPTIVTSEFS